MSLLLPSVDSEAHRGLGKVLGSTIEPVTAGASETLAKRFMNAASLFTSNITGRFGGKTPSAAIKADIASNATAQSNASTPPNSIAAPGTQTAGSRAEIDDDTVIPSSAPSSAPGQALNVPHSSFLQQEQDVSTVNATADPQTAYGQLSKKGRKAVRNSAKHREHTLDPQTQSLLMSLGAQVLSQMMQGSMSPLENAPRFSLEEADKVLHANETQHHTQFGTVYTNDLQINRFGEDMLSMGSSKNQLIQQGLDGHSGCEASQFMAKKGPKYIADAMSALTDVELKDDAKVALVSGQAMIDCDKELLDETRINAGAVGNWSIWHDLNEGDEKTLENVRLTVGGVGDTRTYLWWKDDQTGEITVEMPVGRHQHGNTAWEAEFESRFPSDKYPNAYVQCGPIKRVNGSLAPGNVFGDRAHRPGGYYASQEGFAALTVEPEVVTRRMRETTDNGATRTLVMTAAVSDGLADLMEDKQKPMDLVKFYHDVESSNENPATTAMRLCGIDHRLKNVAENRRFQDDASGFFTMLDPTSRHFTGDAKTFEGDWHSARVHLDKQQELLKESANFTEMEDGTILGENELEMAAMAP